MNAARKCGLLALLCAALQPALAHPAEAEAEALASRMQHLADPGRLPYAVVDKRHALMVIYGPDGRVAGRSAVLLGTTRGDLSRPGVGERAQSGRLRHEDLTTPRWTLRRRARAQCQW